MIYHKYRFGLKGNFKVWLCRRFGHRLNENPDHDWCERCSLAYSECYHPINWAEIQFKKFQGYHGDTDVNEK